MGAVGEQRQWEVGAAGAEGKGGEEEQEWEGYEEDEGSWELGSVGCARGRDQ